MTQNAWSVIALGLGAVLLFMFLDAEDRRAEAQRRRDGLTEPKRDIRTFPGFADGGAAPRD